MVEGLFSRLWMVAAGFGEERIFAYGIQTGPVEGAQHRGQELCLLAQLCIDLVPLGEPGLSLQPMTISGLPQQ